MDDGYTGVADVNSDGIPEVVVLYKTGSGNLDNIRLSVYNPGFFSIDAGGNKVSNATPTPVLLAERIIPTSMQGYGTHSYVFIGDIDGLEQTVTVNGLPVKKKYPEITFLSGGVYGSNNTANAVPLHPNIESYVAPFLRANRSINYGGNGSLISFTWDGTASSVTDMLKVSFILTHQDQSDNTGFTLFDFDNDGRMDICYRDEQYLRIISAAAPYYVGIGDTPTTNSLIKFRQAVRSETGYEYPVIADIDGDSSADMLVMGNSTGGFPGYVFAVEGDDVQFAPAPKVWNQFMYTPLKINENLTVPEKVYNPLDSQYAYIKGEITACFR